MSQEKLAQAQQLIKAKRYTEARALLVQLKGDPTADRWLARLDAALLPARQAVLPTAPSLKDRLTQARDLIAQQKFDEARAVLRPASDHPKVQQWLAKLDELDPPIEFPDMPPAPRARTRTAAKPESGPSANPLVKVMQRLGGLSLPVKIGGAMAALVALTLTVAVVVNVIGGGDSGEGDSDSSPSSGSGEQQLDEDPAGAARQWITAVLANDGVALARYTCAADASLVSNSGMWGTVLQLGAGELVSGLGSLKLDSDLSDLTFTVIGQDSQQASVQLGGQFQVAMGGMFQTFEVQDIMPMIYEDGRWKYCPSTGSTTVNVPSTPVPVGQTILINTLVDDPRGCPQTCTLRSAASTAQPGDVLMFDPSLSGTLTLAQPLTLDKSLTINGPGSDKVTVRLTPAEKAIMISAGVTVTISGLTIQGTQPGQSSSSILNEGVLSMDDVTLTHHQYGAVTNVGTLDVTRSAFLYNDGAGGNYYTLGAIYNQGVLTVTDSVFNGNKNVGIYNARGSSTIERTLFTDNSLQSVLHNDAQATMTVNDCTFEKNSSDAGGAIGSYGVLVVSNSRFSDNRADRAGGAIMTRGDQSLISDSIFVQNRSGDIGGAVIVMGTTTITGSTFFANVAERDGGGGVYVENESTITNSTFYQNQAVDGGGVMVGWNTVLLVNVTAAENTASHFGGGVFIDDNSGLSMGNTLLAHNSAQEGPDMYGSFISLGSNLVMERWGTGYFASDQLGVDPLLGALSPNGGLTDTIPLMDGSPAIDKGDPSLCPPTDQRGAARVGACDVGAFEWGGQVGG